MLTETSYGAIGGLPTTSPDGTFTLNNVMAGEYRLSLLLQPGYYIKEARYNGSDVLNGPLLVSSSITGNSGHRSEPQSRPDQWSSRRRQTETGPERADRSYSCRTTRSLRALPDVEHG